MSAFKDEVRELMHTDPEAARDKLAALKGAMIDDITPIDPQRAAILNKLLQQSDVTEPLAELDMLNKTPRQLRGLSRGVAIGALTAAIPAYMMHARGEGQ
jgi:N12 class adenine-specific DNA methylase